MSDEKHQGPEYLDEDDEKPLSEWTVDEAMAEVNTCYRQLTYWEMELAPILKPMYAAKDDLDRAKRRLARVMTERGQKRTEDDDFRVVAVSPNKGSYNLEKLPRATQDRLRRMPGVVTEKVNNDQVRKAIEHGLLDEHELALAWEEQESSPYVKVSVKQE